MNLSRARGYFLGYEQKIHSWAHSPGTYFSLRSQKTNRIQVTVSSQRLLRKEKIWCLEYNFIYLPIWLVGEMLHQKWPDLFLCCHSLIDLINLNWAWIKMTFICINLIKHDSRKGVLAPRTWHDWLLRCQNLVQFLSHPNKTWSNSRRAEFRIHPNKVTMLSPAHVVMMWSAAAPHIMLKYKMSPLFNT